MNTLFSLVFTAEEGFSSFEIEGKDIIVLCTFWIWWGDFGDFHWS